jgi:hypothetical protein
MANGAIFSGCVEALQHDEERALPLGKQAVLQTRECFDVPSDLRRRLLMVCVPTRKGRVEIAKLDRA